MHHENLEPAVAAGTDVRARARLVLRLREGYLSGDLSPSAAGGSLRKVIAQDWAAMARAGVDSARPTPRFLDQAELRSLRCRPDLALAWEVLRERVRNLSDDTLLTVLTDARGCVVRVGGTTAVLDEAARFGFLPGARWADQGTNGIALVVRRRRAAQLFHAEHWAASHARWSCTAVPILDPHTSRLLAVANVTGPWAHVHPSQLGWLHEIGSRVTDELGTAEHRAEWSRVLAGVGPLHRMGGPVLVVDRRGVVIAAHGYDIPSGDLLCPDDVLRPGPGFLPRVGPCTLEPLPMRGWLVREGGDGGAYRVAVTLDLSEPGTPMISIAGPTVRWPSAPLPPAHARILRELARNPGGLTPAELHDRIHGPGDRCKIEPTVCKLRNRFGGLLDPGPRGRYRLSPFVTVDVVEPDATP